MSQFSQQFRYLRSRFGAPALRALPAPAAVPPSQSALTIESEAVAPAGAAQRRKSVLAHPSMGALLIALGAVVGAKFLASTERPEIVRETPTIAAPTQSYKTQVAQTGTTPPIQQKTARASVETPAGPVGATPLTAPAQVASNVYFPEPKTVKSVATDSRGRIVDPTPTGTIRPAPVATPFVVATAKPETKPETIKPETTKPEVAKLAAAKPEIVKSTAKVEVRAEPTTIVASNPTPSAAPANVDVRVQLPPDAPLNLSVVAKAPDPLPPVAQDQRPPATVVDSARFGRSGGVSIQLAAASTEDEARALAEKLQHRFSYQLDGRPLEIIPAKPRDRIVYRLRLTEISRDEADAICASLRANRAGCFVARD
ncbi:MULTISPECIES: SPOR domain-containing protein [unclassified Beijerinckia]|uniref:SPOR domain-containing protein n=1 Tax=unclassified Beijerinckia TaxID=2638183 RepID=UPI00089B9808|nr:MULTISPECIES: SPOR domain-containing protein [unclassified Beijerinckia]MDH7794790.1 hypothetical protein [Beijerinckia sp. GAS462]SEB75321.1 Sporulation related domain-containing protein [Beijerinckia sp. 28-YEA-48]